MCYVPQPGYLPSFKRCSNSRWVQQWQSPSFSVCNAIHPLVTSSFLCKNVFSDIAQCSFLMKTDQNSLTYKTTHKTITFLYFILWAWIQRVVYANRVRHYLWTATTNWPTTLPLLDIWVWSHCGIILTEEDTKRLCWVVKRSCFVFG
jgi:hypothetical protein